MTTFGCCYRCAPSSPSSSSSSSLRRSNRRRRGRRKSNAIIVESKFTFLPSSAESFANTNAISDTTTFLDVARACARRLRLAKELHPSGKDAQIIVGTAGPPEWWEKHARETSVQTVLKTRKEGKSQEEQTWRQRRRSKRGVRRGRGRGE